MASMVQLQIINKILDTKSIDIIRDNGFTREYFPEYTNEMIYIMDHYNHYGTVPDKTTFLTKFSDFELFEVNEGDKYLAETLSEEYTYGKLAHVIQKAADLTQSNSFNGVNYLNSELAKLKVTQGVNGIDIIANAKARLDSFNDRRTNIDNWYISSGFPEMDEVIHGIQLKEELIILFARTGQGKSFVLTKMLESCWEFGKNVGYISPEMSSEKVGYRFDSAFKHFNNNNLNYGNDVEGYDDYIENLPKEHKNKFVVAQPVDFNNRITVSKIRSFISKYNIEILGIDGMSYLEDENRSKYDSRQAELTHISKDLFDMSSELGIPIIAVVQANRSGVTENNGDLELENIRDADGIAYSATKIISVRNMFEVGNIVLKINKHRDGKTGSKFTYRWSPQTGEYFFIPTETDEDDNTDSVAAAVQKQSIDKVAQSFADDNPANVF